ncbi:hypothetical protein AMAG_19121 [Allomyces macrogynus ATCC 38327]|uniref:Uncharacterized protein n=1 Tax=Allomyces macrogynus (strain ATCC 38327) TaxID=578462 RepID=A0A0L0SP53_ALLM3|nr:hypothetical protein AMAG_19121 [Allomyces macrogynus ATCC 38327]|eukprot:KNE64150.1 hypothetical protein AMAG_19121 [Allomyces macrogynus ATCC 38327]
MYYSTPSDSAIGIPTLVLVPSPYDPKLAREAVVTAMQRWTTFPWKPFREAMAAAKMAQAAAAAAAAAQDSGESAMAVDTQSVPMDEDEPAETGAAEKAADATRDEAMAEDPVPAPDDLEQFMRVEREPTSGSWRSNPLLAGDFVTPGTVLRVVWTAAAAEQAFADAPPPYGRPLPPPPPPPTNVAVGFHPATAIGGVGPIVPHVAPPSPSSDIIDLSGDKSDSDEVSTGVAARPRCLRPCR